MQATLGVLVAEAAYQDLKKVHCAGLNLYLFGKGVANKFVVQQLQQRMPAYKITTTADLGVLHGLSVVGASVSVYARKGSRPNRGNWGRMSSNFSGA